MDEPAWSAAGRYSGRPGRSGETKRCEPPKRRFILPSAHAASIHLVNDYFRSRHKGRGQALYSSANFGAGGALGSLLSGRVWQGIGPSVTFAVASISALAGALIAAKWADSEKRARAPQG